MGRGYRLGRVAAAGVPDRVGARGIFSGRPVRAGKAFTCSLGAVHPPRSQFI